MSPIACSLAALLVLETAPAGSSECPLTDNRCKAERFMQRAATAASSAVRAKYLEAAHGSFLALYDAAGDVRDLCAARRTFEQTLAALGAEAATKRLAPLEHELEKRERARRPRCAPGPSKAPKPPALASAESPARARPPASTGLKAEVSPSPPAAALVPPMSPERGLMPVPVAHRAPVTPSISSEAMRIPSRSATMRDAPAPAGPPAAMRDVSAPANPTRNDPARADRRLIIAGSVTAGLGLSLVGVAGYAGSQRVEARRASLELLAEAQGQATAEQTAQDIALRDRYQTMGHLALGTSLAGGAAVLVGVTMAAEGGRRLALITRRMALGPLPGGLVFRARF